MTPKQKAPAAAPTPITPRLLTVKQAAAYCSCAVWAIRQLCWSKELRSMRLGHRILIDRADLDALIDRRKRWTEDGLNRVTLIDPVNGAYLPTITSRFTEIRN
jgi:excisionase family DNA binding protein